MLCLAPNPPCVVTLADDDMAALRAKDPTIPSSPKQCITCGGTPDWPEVPGGTFTWRGNTGAPMEFECDCGAQFQAYLYMLNAGVQLRYQRLYWSDLYGVSDSVREQIMSYVDTAEQSLRMGHGLILMSPHRGTGKTLLANLTLKALLRRGVDGFFTTFNDMLDATTAGYDSPVAKQWFDRRIRNAGFLVVDDVGREHAGRTIGESVFDSVVRSRSGACKPTLITTNKDMDYFETRYSSNVVSLLSEVNDIIEVAGQDYRPQAKEIYTFEMKNGLTRPVVL